MFGLLNTNSLWSLSVTKSISDPSKVICALLSMNTFTPEEEEEHNMKTTNLLPIYLLVNTENGKMSQTSSEL